MFSILNNNIINTINVIYSIMRADIAGRDVTRYLKLLLRKEGHDFHTTAEFEIVKMIKEVR